MLTLTSNYLDTSAFYYFYDFNYRSHIEEKKTLYWLLLMVLWHFLILK